MAKKTGACLLVLLVLVLLLPGCAEEKQNQTTGISHTPGVVDLDRISGFTAVDKQETELGQGLYITAVGRYTGSFVEKGGSTPVTDVLAICVENRGKKPVQVARIHLDAEGERRDFQLTTLPVGTTALVMEQSAASWEDVRYTGRSLANCAFFADELSIQPERFGLLVTDGFFTVENRAEAVEGDVLIYYKNIVSGVYLGGITYRVRVSGGLKKGESCQVPASHYTVSGSQILFVTGG